MKRTNLQKGFTLVETLLYVAIFSLFLVAASSFMGYMFSSRLKSQTVMLVNEQGAQVIESIERMTRNSLEVTSPSIGTSGSVLSITTNNPINNPTVISLIGDALFVQEASNSPIALTNDSVKVKNLVFSNMSRAGYPITIQIRFRISTNGLSDTAEGVYENDFYGGVTLRK